MGYEDGPDIYAKILIRKKQGNESQIRRLEPKNKGLSDTIAGIRQ